MSLKLVVVRNMQLLVLSAVCSFVDLIIMIIKLAVERLKINFRITFLLCPLEADLHFCGCETA